MCASNRPSLVTRASLLFRLRDWNDATSWSEFDRLYRRLVHGMACRAGLTSDEADDVVQDVFQHVAEKIAEFESRDRRGAFRNWLKTQTAWRITDKFRERRRDLFGTLTGEAPAANAAHDDERSRALEPLADHSAYEVTDEAWQADWEQHVLDAAMERIARRVPAKHFQAFDLYARQNWPVGRVARELDLHPATVYLIKHRLTRQLKSEVARLRASLE
ncbi:MAG TPA: sigma-70 family RNA polymerase sigma factor [Opitutaceae bacterium]